ncbi:MAG: OmpH family outer membrane protein [Bacteroidetes bacterium]|nr:OmpH family outer membrane protein [Bacteroidota bacterium]
MTDEINTPAKKSPKIELVLSIISIIGVVILFVMEFIIPDEPDNLSHPAIRPSLSSGSNSIVFVNSDLILEKYELVSALSTRLELDRSHKDADLTTKQKAYEKDAAYFQEQVQKQSISETSAQEIYEKLMIQQQELMNLQDQYAAELSKKEFEMNVTLVDSVRNYLSRMNEYYNYDYILGYNSTGNIFLAKDTFDITEQVIEGLNKEYRVSKNLQK